MVFLDAIHYKVREDQQVVTKAAYVVSGIDLDGRKDPAGLLDRGARVGKILA